MIDIEIVDCIALDEGDATIGLGWILEIRQYTMDRQQQAASSKHKQKMDGLTVMQDHKQAQAKDHKQALAKDHKQALAA